MEQQQQRLLNSRYPTVIYLLQNLPLRFWEQEEEIRRRSKTNVAVMVKNEGG
jgi:hypothetical protein